VEGDGGGDGGLLGAGGEAVGGVFDVAAGDDVAVLEEEGGADAEVAVGGVGVAGYRECALVEVFDLCGGDADVWFGLRHRVEAIECD
jgi:hypothetical protein